MDVRPNKRRRRGWIITAILLVLLLIYAAGLYWTAGRIASDMERSLRVPEESSHEAP